MPDTEGDVETAGVTAMGAAEDTADVVARDGEGAITEVTQESYCGQLGQSFTGACFGLILFFGSIGLLVYNEGRTVKRAKDIDEGQEIVVELDLALYNTTSSVPGDKFANKLVHAVGDLSTADTLVDPIFGVGGGENSTGKSLKLSRSVEMYQWKETKKGGKHGTKYYYEKQWLGYIENSNNFRNSEYRNTNPTDFPFAELFMAADPIFLGNGGIQLSSEAASLLNWYEPVDAVSLNDVIDTSLKSRLEIFQSNGIYYHVITSNGTSSGVNNPVIGDVRVRFDHVPPDTVSIIAVYLTNDSVVDTYTTSRGGTLLFVKRGNFTAAEMFQQADEENTMRAWILRFVGFFLMWVSILLILQPLATAVDIIPFIGDFVQGSLEGCLFPLIAFLIALPISLFTVALAWMAYHPAWAVPLLFVTGGILAWLYCRVKKAKQDADGNSNNDSTDMDKPPYKINDEQAVTSSYPYGSNSNHDNNTAATNNYNNNSEVGVECYPIGGGFAGALDNPPPTVPQSTAIPIVEPDVVMAQPYNPSYEVEANKPFVPQVYKP